MLLAFNLSQEVGCQQTTHFTAFETEALSNLLKAVLKIPQFLPDLGP